VSTQLAPERAPEYRPLEARRAVPWIIFVVFFAVLNETVFNVSTPAIVQQFGLTPSGVSWVMTAFIVFFGIGSVIFGRLSDIFSLRRLIVIGICVYAGGSLLGFALQSFYPAIIAARVIQGVGASAIPALIMVVVARFFAPGDRGRIFGTITSTVAFAAGIGPVIGGFISGTLHWTYLFLIPPFTLISIPFFLRVLPAEATRPGTLDVLGAALVAAAVGSFILFLSFTAWYYLAASLAALTLFVLRILRARNPFIEPSLFRNRRFRAGLLVGFIVFSAAFGIFFMVPLMLSSLAGLNTRSIGLIMFPGAISGVVFGTVGGNLADRKGNPFVVVIGLASITVSLLLISSLLGASPWYLAGALLLTYIGFCLIQTALINGVSQTLEIAQTGVGMGLFNLISFISGAVGGALVGRILGSGGLAFPLNPFITDGRAFAYSNLMLAFAVLVVLAGIIYIRSKPKKN
jgi:DHA2 family metal-tetracycline-proton antiporter-like MFS transporter